MLEPNKPRTVPRSVVVLLVALVLGLFTNAFLVYRLTAEVTTTRELAMTYADSFLGKILLKKYDLGALFNPSIAQQLSDDLYFNFQQSAEAVEKLATLTSTTALTRAQLFDGTVRVVFYAVASYANMVASIASTVQSIPPMTMTATTEQQEERRSTRAVIDVAPTVQGVPDDSFNLLQEVTNVISELPDWAQDQLNVTAWKILGVSCEKFLNNALSVEWDSTYVAYDWHTGIPRKAEWEIPHFVLGDIIFPIQSVCENVATWNVKAIKEEEKRLHLARTERKHEPLDDV